LSFAEGLLLLLTDEEDEPGALADAELLEALVVDFVEADDVSEDVAEDVSEEDVELSGPEAAANLSLEGAGIAND